MFNQLQVALSTLREMRPMVLCLTNSVTIEFVANSLLAVGATPIMSACKEELLQLLKLSQALYINIGTLDSSFARYSSQLAKAAGELGVPVILDPVGSGASIERTECARSLLKNTSILKANASEVRSLAGELGETRGVDSLHTVNEALESAVSLAQQSHCVVAVTGKKDLITDGENTAWVSFGSPIMTRVTGMGCVLGALVAAFSAVMPSRYQAALLATNYMGLSGQLTGLVASSPGTFRQLFIDTLYSADFEAMRQLLEVSCEI